MLYCEKFHFDTREANDFEFAMNALNDLIFHVCNFVVDFNYSTKNRF
jgi:hypothetical protein